MRGAQERGERGVLGEDQEIGGGGVRGVGGAARLVEQLKGGVGEGEGQGDAQV